MWEKVSETVEEGYDVVERLVVPSGWLYRTFGRDTVTVTFVPTPAATSFEYKTRADG